MLNNQLSRGFTFPDGVVCVRIVDRVFVLESQRLVGLLISDLVNERMDKLLREPTNGSLGKRHQLCGQFSRLVLVAIDLAAPVA